MAFYCNKFNWIKLLRQLLLRLHTTARVLSLKVALPVRSLSTLFASARREL